MGIKGGGGDPFRGGEAVAGFHSRTSGPCSWPRNQTFAVVSQLRSMPVSLPGRSGQVISSRTQLVIAGVKNKGALPENVLLYICFSKFSCLSSLEKDTIY